MISLHIGLPYWISHRLDSRLPNQGWAEFYRHGKVNDHRSWEFQTGHFGFDTLLSIRAGLALQGADHASPEFELNVLGFMLHFTMPDNRHWNHEHGRWALPGEGWDAYDPTPFQGPKDD